MTRPFMLRAALLIAATLATTAHAADTPAPRQADWTAHDFTFHTGEVMPATGLARVWVQPFADFLRTIPLQDGEAR